MLRYGCGFGRRTPRLSHAQAGLDLCDLIEAALEADGVVGSSGMTTRRRMLNIGGVEVETRTEDPLRGRDR